MSLGIAKELSILSRLTSRTPDEEARYQDLLAQSKAANDRMAANFAAGLKRPSRTSVEPFKSVMRNTIPLDSIVATVPPVYRLNWLVTSSGRLTPRSSQPIQMVPHGFGEVLLKFWGFDTFDVHTAFPSFKQYAYEERGHEYCILTAVNYSITVHAGAGEDNPGVSAHYNHSFKVGSQAVYLGLQGIHSNRPIFKFYKALEHLPKLPHDWQYMQFIA